MPSEANGATIRCPGQDAEEYPGPACYCGKRGCIETFLCGPALERQYRELSGNPADARAIAERALLGEPAAKSALATYSRRLAKALATVINVVDPDIFVFGGGLSNIPALMDEAAAQLPAWVFSDCFATPLKVNKWGDFSGVKGGRPMTHCPGEPVKAGSPAISMPAVPLRHYKLIYGWRIVQAYSQIITHLDEVCQSRLCFPKGDAVVQRSFLPGA